MSQIAEELDPFDDVSNPLDSVEDIFFSNEWNFERETEDELSVTVTGKMGTYSMKFVWQEDFSAMQFTCSYDLCIPEARLGEAAIAASAINAKLWLGHFDIQPGTKEPCFRHTTLFRGVTGCSGAEHIEDLVDIALSECERYYSAFDLLSCTQKPKDGDLSLAMMDSAGAA